ncbi:MAG: DEAD/DEAH box helicase [Candidatus Paceibacterota bacterium]|jgi:superfamily II DNA or RNA helicase
MLTAESVRRAIRREVESKIYTRGDEYFRHGYVKKWLAEKNDDGDSVVITGDIRGSEMYDVFLEFNIARETFDEISCSCPYYDNCKHAVSLALAYAESLKKEAQAKSMEPKNEETILREALRNLGISADAVPNDVIEKLLEYKKPELRQGILVSVPDTVKPQKEKKLKVFDPNDYYVQLNTYGGYAPSFFNKSNPYQTASLVKILGRDDITSAQRELLEYIKGKNFGHYLSPPPDVEKMFPLLAESGFPICKNYSYDKKRLKIELSPEKLKAEIVHEARELYGDESKVKYNFYFRMAEEYWKGRESWHDKPFLVKDNCVVRENKDILEFHRLTPLLAAIISRVHPHFYHNNGKTFYQTELMGDEISNFDKLAYDAGQFFSLSSVPSLRAQKVETEPTPAIQVDFNNDEQTLRVVPVFDYGIYQSDISENIFISHRAGGNVPTRRPPYEHPGSHIITVENDVIRYCRVEEEKEIEWYQELALRAEEFGFTKTLKCSKKKANPVAEYLRDFWPKLLVYANECGYPIIFTKDELAHETAVFRADFSADMDADNDWLYFDLNCYCGDERVTLKKLFDFMERKESFWRKDDGTLVEISNPKELERLIRLLKSFHEREEGGYEGRMHHAAELEYVMTSSEHYNSVRAKGLEQFLRRMQKGKPIKKVHMPEKLLKILRPYQKDGIEWLYFLRSYRFAGILADDMGLGKTLQALVVLDKEKIAGKPSLVVCPKTLLYNWKLEAEKFFPKMNVLVYDGNPNEREEMQKKAKDCDLVVASYGTVRRDENFFSNAKTKFNYAVLDEAQFIKNHATKNAQIVKKINADYRLALTGTPMENSVSELWSIYDFLMPGFLGNYEHFSKHFHKPIMDAGDRSALEHLRRKVESFMLRRTKAEVLKDLPPKIEQMSQCHLSESQNILYQQILAKVRGEIFETVKEKGFKNAQIHILAGLTKLRQACNHPALLTKDKNFHEYESAKLDMCMELVEEIAEGGRKVLIFSQFTGMLDIVSSILKERNISHAYLSGKTKDRQSLVKKFNEDSSITVFLISLKAGGTGLNLTSADTVIVFDPWWNPSVENQAIDRAHRIGQTKTVNVYRLLTSGTIEEKIQALKQKKQRLFDALVGESGDMFKKLTWEDVRELFAGE